MTEEERVKFLEGLALDDDGDKLADPGKTVQTGVQESNPKAIQWAPPGVDPHTMEVKQIVFTDDMLDGWDLTNAHPASAYLFSQYRSKVNGKDLKDTDRHSHLHNRISTFVFGLRDRRDSDGVIREKIKTTAEQRQLAQMLAAAGGTVKELAPVVKLVKALEAKGLSIEQVADLIASLQPEENA